MWSNNVCKIKICAKISVAVKKNNVKTLFYHRILQGFKNYIVLGAQKLVQVRKIYQDRHYIKIHALLLKL